MNSYEDTTEDCHYCGRPLDNQSCHVCGRDLDYRFCYFCSICGRGVCDYDSQICEEENCDTISCSACVDRHIRIGHAAA